MKKLHLALLFSAFLGLSLASTASAEISANVSIQRYGVRNLTKSESVYSQNIKAVDGDELEFSINVKNISSNQANVGVLYVYLPTGFPLDSNSIYIDGIRTGGNVSNGLFLGNIKDGAQKDIVFKTKVNASLNGYAAIQALVAGENFNTDSQYVSITKNGSETDTIVNGFTPTPTPTPTSTVTNQNNNLSVSLKGKNLTKEAATWQKAIKAEPGNLLEFSVMLYTNTNLVARNVQTKVGLDSFLDFVPGSVTVNGSPVSDNLTLDSVLVGNISIQETKFIKFQVRVRNAPQFGKEPIVLSSAVQVWADNNVRITDYSSISVAVKQVTAKTATGPVTVSNKNNGSKVAAVTNNQKFELTVPKETIKTTEKKSSLFGTIGFGSFWLLIVLILIALIIFLIIALAQEKKKCKDKTAV